MDIESASVTPAAGRFAGRRLGPYRLIATIGSGGMGEVYRATRADEYRQEVAIKLVRAGQDLAFTAQRMRAERQILASFEHPAIARLLDGGTTHEGIPYLVMELIDGQPITTYCNARGLGVTERLALFLQVCSAVQYAHQRMVVHRDLKPSNILVTADGAPKLLDFGIAKILDSGAGALSGAAALPADATINAQRILTPQYASPEQMRGEAVSASSDVYSLGVILYELLTGARPYTGGERLTSDVLGAVYAPEAKRPSAVVRPRAAGSRAAPERPAGVVLDVIEGSPERLARRLKGDLDNIVLMALRREPARRYATVEQLAQDIERHLQCRPVAARKPTLGYRTSSFVARHKLAVSAAVLAALALVAGLALTAWQARVATAQRARAERRFDDVRHLADTLIFDVHDSIADLPGAASSRRLVVDTALRYLDELSGEAADDPALEREIGRAYMRLGDVQGRALEANEGDFRGAFASYRRALTLFDASLAADPRNAQTLRELIVICGKLSDLTWYLGDVPSALAYSRRTITESGRFAAEHPNEARAPILLATSELDYGYKLFKIRGDSRAESHLRRSTAALESLAAAAPKNARLARTLAMAYSRTAQFLSYRGRDAEALSFVRKSRSVLERLAADAPQNTDYRHLLAFADRDAADILADMGRLDEASRDDQAALAAFQRLAASDPKLMEYQEDVGMTLSSLATIALARNEPARAIGWLRGSLQRLGPVSEGVESSTSRRWALAYALATQGRAYGRLAVDAHRPAPQRVRDALASCDAYRSAGALYRVIASSWVQAADQGKKLAPALARCRVDAAREGKAASEPARTRAAKAPEGAGQPEPQGRPGIMKPRA